MASSLGWRVTLTCWNLFAVHRGPPRSSSSDPDFVVVDGVPVMLPSYDEAVSGGLSALGPGYLAPGGQGCPLPVDDQSPPAYPGSGDTDTGPGESETCDSVSGSSELLPSLYPSPTCPGGTRPASDNPGTAASAAGEVASTSPGIDIADGKCLPPGPALTTAPAPGIFGPAQSRPALPARGGRGQGQLGEEGPRLTRGEPRHGHFRRHQGHPATVQSGKARVASPWFSERPMTPGAGLLGPLTRQDF